MDGEPLMSTLVEIRKAHAQVVKADDLSGVSELATGLGAGVMAVGSLRARRKPPVKVSRKLVRRLNRMPKERDAADLGVVGGRTLMGTYYPKGHPKYIPPTVRRLRDEVGGATWWSSDQKHVNRIRTGKQPILVNRRKYQAARQLIDNSAPTRRTIHRGISDDAAKYRPGRKVSVPESSWSESRAVAEAYTRRGKGANKVVMHTVPGTRKRAAHIAPLTRYRNSEWVTPKANYRVVARKRSGDTSHVYVKQTR